MTKAEKCKQIRLIAESCEQKDIPSVFKNKLEKMVGGSNVVIYGAGTAGRMFTRYFLDMFGNRNAINCFLDKNAADGQTCLDYLVYKPDDLRFDQKFRKDALVIIAILLDDVQYNEIIESLKKIGYTKFTNAMPLIIQQLLFILRDINDDSTIASQAGNIESALELMADEHSDDVFISHFNAHVTANYDMGRKLSVGMTQYVDVNVTFRHNYRSFVDCGAYTGDTFEDLIKRHKVKQYFGFEPDMLNYAKLLQNIDVLQDKAQRCVVLPLGVGDKNKYVRFSSAEDSSIANDTGDDIVQIVCLDDILKGYDDLFIKMDIEGAEISALKGAKNIIENTAPDLAICVYHRISDLWRIPLMLKEYVPEYKFYMRNHHAYFFDTVLYATLGQSS